jgi:hypothetical protein
MEDFITDAGIIDLAHARELGVLHLLRKIKVTRTTRGQGEKAEEIESTEIQLYDAQAALDKLMRFYGLYIDKLVVEDWRQAAREAGIENPDGLFEHAKREIEKELARTNDGGSVAGGARKPER